ncbi:MAG TPA: diguanylate cyclase [Anaerolineae bacterium]|nr:diguanylate cyclase [Anaerolineae bacterium]
MELKAYLHTLVRKWRIFVPAFLLTLGVTAALTFTQPAVYQARASYIVRLASFIRDDRGLVSALDTLSRRTEIATTFAEVANSRLIKEQAAQVLSLSAGQQKGLSAESRLVAGTNILSVETQGPDPFLVSNYANAIGASIDDYTRNLYEAYGLELLDEAVPPNAPIRPNKPLNLLLGLVAGLVLGGGLAFLDEYLRGPSGDRANSSIVDSETGAHSKRFFLLRLRQEMSRAKRNGYPLAVALIDINHRGVLDGASPQVCREALRRAVAVLEPYLRDEDLMTHFSDTVLAILLPDMTEQKAREMTEELRARLGWAPLELERSGLKLNVHGAAGVVAYDGNGMGQDDLLNQAARALAAAGNDTYGKVRLYSEFSDKD